MAKYYTTNTLIDSVKRRGSLPETQVTFQETDFLAFTNEEMDIGIVPHILSFHEDYLLFSEDISLESNITRYPLPSRAIGNKLREVSYKDSNGSIYEMSRITIEDVPYFQFSSGEGISNKVFYMEGNEIVIFGNNNNSDGFLRVSYYIRPSEIVSEDRTCRVSSVDYNKGIIFLQNYTDTITPGMLLDITSSKSPFKIIGKDVIPDNYGSTTDLTLTFGTQKIYTTVCLAPASIADSSYFIITNRTSGSSINTAIWFDKTGSSPAPVVSGATLLRADISTAITAANVTTILDSLIDLNFGGNIIADASGANLTIKNAGNSICVGDNFDVTDNNTSFIFTISQTGTNTLPRHIGNNDVISLAEETCIPQIPSELHSMLAQRVTMRCLEALGDQAGLTLAAAKLLEMEQKTGSLIDSRVEGAPLKVAPKNTFLRRGRNYLRR